MKNKYLYSDSELSGGEPIFLLDITWGGRVYYLSSRPIEIATDSGTPIIYTGGLQDFNFIESMDLMDIDPENNILSCAVIFDVDPLKEFSEGNYLEGSKAVFSYVINRADKITVNHESRVILLRGKVQEPQYGDPEEPIGFLSLSVEQDQFDTDTPLLDPDLKIDSRFVERHTETADGKPWPIVFGLPTRYSVPVYCYELGKLGSGALSATRWLIAQHPIEATQIVLQDDKFDSQSVNVVTQVDNTGNTFASVGYAPALGTTTGLACPRTTGAWIAGTTRTWYATFNSTHGGGMLNPYGEGILEKGGDLCRWALSQTDQLIDDGAWAGLSPLLNKFKFAGYINDPDVSAWDWLAGNILPWLPISVRSGPNGLKPVLNQLDAITHLDSILKIKIGYGQEFELLGPIETIRSTSELINQFSFRFAKRGWSQDYTEQVRVTNKAVKNYDIRSDYSSRSINLYGLKNGTGESDYVYDKTTAQMIALQEVARRSLPIRSINISGPFHYGYVQIGDIINLNSDSLYLDDHKSIVIEKEWTGASWRFKLAFSFDTIK